MTWGWAALGLLFVAAAALILQSVVALGRLDALFLAGLGGLMAWTGLSSMWSESPPLSVLEFERTVMYFGGALALLLIVRRSSFAAALGGLLAADVMLCVHALATRLVPDRVEGRGSSVGFRLAGELAYPNALGIVAVLGLLIALGFCADARRAAVRAGAAVASVPLVLVLYFSNSRGSWVALVIGLVGAVALSTRRREVARACVPLVAVGALSIWLASRSRSLTRWDDPLAAAHDGHRLLAASVALTVLAALLCAQPTRRIACAAVAVAALAVVIAPSGSGPVLVPSSSGPVVPGSPAPGTTPTDRLFSATSNSRTEYWRVAVVDIVDHPLVGSGAGTFVREWYRHRRVKADVQDAHSLYLETLAELGVIGFTLLLFVFAIPVVAASRVRREPYVVGAFGSYVAYSAHAAVDWDWELPAVTFAGLFCGGLLIVAARSEDALIGIERRWRGALLAAALALGAFSFVGLVGNRAEAAALGAATRGEWGVAATEAHRGRRWAPWSANALVLAADAASARGDVARQRSLLRLALGKDARDHRIWSRLAAVTTGTERARALQRAAELNPLG